MIWSASLLLLAAAQAGDSVPSALEAQVRELVAARWAIGPAELELEWGRHAALDGPAADAPIRLNGSGVNGWFVVIREPLGSRPVAITLRAGTRRPRPEAARPLTPGTRLRAADIRIAERIVWGPPVDSADAAAAALAVADGWEVRRALVTGDPLVIPAVQPPRLVASGDPVTFVWSRGPVRMERVAIAQGSARLGERVQAQAGGARLAGIVIGARLARVPTEEQP